MPNLEDEFFETIKVVKRNGSKVGFNGTKIAMAIKKGFDSIKETDEDGEERTKYGSNEIQRVYQDVIETIKKDYQDKERIKIEEIQDIIEDTLKKDGFEDVFESFSDYRDKRAQSREAFTEDKRSHKFLKTLEGLALKSAAEDDTKRENGNIDGNSAMGTMLQFGSNVSKEFSKTYLMKKRYADAHDDGYIHIHDMDFL
ncbi:MAG TPA: anaerobic ribonucleoside triphosphate reductase, partial [Candidatus Onthocola stercoravium]|nr:anaerobic ribonucleoside triphosphate reductase [Candidatus Onthocola stercoravium]